MSALRLYTSTKKVMAAQILEIREKGNEVELDIGSPGEAETITRPRQWFHHHKPQVGGFIVVYPDSYVSYCPPDAFTGGNVLTPPNSVEGHKPDDDELRRRFLYHPVRDAIAAARHEAISKLCLELARNLRDMCFPGRMLSLALTDLELVRMHANASIACDDPRP